MMFYVTVVAFLMALLMNEFICTIMDDSWLDEVHTNY